MCLLNICRCNIFTCDRFFSLQRGFTPLMVASEFGHIKIVKLLLEHGADVNTQNQVFSIPYGQNDLSAFG